MLNNNEKKKQVYVRLTIALSDISEYPEKGISRDI